MRVSGLGFRAWGLGYTIFRGKILDELRGPQHEFLYDVQQGAA